MGTDEVAQQAKAVWSAGDFGVIAKRVAVAGENVAAAAQVSSGDRVLDIACGTGNSAIPAAKAGGSVVALDIVPELLKQGEERAAEAGVEIEWVEGNAQDLPFEDAEFDRVISVFGCMFAPDHKATALEIARVLKPGGRLAIGAWTPDSAIATQFRKIAEHMPAPPPGFQPPPLWGSEEHLTELFEGTGIELSFRREAVEFHFPSAEEGITEMQTFFGPMVKLRERLEADGTWDEVRPMLVATMEEDNISTDGDQRHSADYLVTTGVKS